MNKLYHIFLTSFQDSINQAEAVLRDSHSIFYTSDGNQRKPKQWTKILKIFLNEFYAENVKTYLASLNLTKIKDTTLYGIYNQNFFEPIDISLISDNKDKEKQAQIITPLLGSNEINTRFRAIFGADNVENFTSNQISNIWDVFTIAFFNEVNKQPINIFNNNTTLKDGVFYAINDGYLKITKNDFTYLTNEEYLNQTSGVKTIFKLPINFRDIKNWDSLSTNKDDNNYSIFKEFVLSKVNNIDALSGVIADLLQPLINTEILPIMIGSGGGGKSTLQNFLTNILGENIVGSINLVQALNNPFEREVLYTHPIVFTSELESSSFKEQATLKQLVSRETTQLNLKHQSVKKARPIAKIFVASNNILKTTDSDGLNRRLCFISFNSNRIRDDLNITEFNRTFNDNVVGLTALVIKGAMMLLNQGWNYNTFNNLSDVELQKEFEGQYNTLNAFLTNLLEVNWIKNETDSLLNLSTLADLLKILNLAELDTTFVNGELLNIIDNYNPKQESKKALLGKVKSAGYDKLETKLNNRYHLNPKTEIIKVLNERKYLSNIGYRYQATTLLTNLSLNFNNDDLINFLKNSTIKASVLDELIPDFKKKLRLDVLYYTNGTNVDEIPLKDIKIPLIDLFSAYAPMCLSLNQNRLLEFEFNTVWLEEQKSIKLQKVNLD